MESGTDRGATPRSAETDAEAQRPPESRHHLDREPAEPERASVHDVEPRRERAKDGLGAGPSPAPRQQRPPFVRERRPHISQPPVNDVQADDTLEHNYSHESGYTLSNHRPMSSRTYRRSRSDVTKVKKELKYGQYLSVPKGSREIFGTHDRTRHRQMVVICVAVVIVVVIVAVYLLMQQ